MNQFKKQPFRILTHKLLDIDLLMAWNSPRHTPKSTSKGGEPPCRASPSGRPGRTVKFSKPDHTRTNGFEAPAWGTLWGSHAISSGSRKRSQGLVRVCGQTKDTSLKARWENSQKESRRQQGGGSEKCSTHRS